MASDVVSVPLRELSIRITKGTTPTKGDGFVSHGINYIKSESITADGSIDDSKFAFIDEKTHDKLTRSQLRAGNVLFSMAGVYLGKTAVVLPKHLPANTNQAVGIITLDESKADPRFVHYTLQSPACRAWVMRSAAQSAQPNFNLQEIGDLPIPVFSLEEQRAIARTLGALDDRIDNLRQINATLQAIAAALFKSWFVDFDNVLAADMQESKLGLIPKGWRVASLGEAFEINPKRELKKGTVAPYLDMASAPTVGAVPKAPVMREFSSGTKFINGDTLLARITPCLENGKTAFVSFLQDGQTGWGSTEFIVLRPKPPLPPFFGYLLARREDFRAHAIQAMSGTSGRQRIEIGQLQNFKLAIPNKATADLFSTIVQPLQKALFENEARVDTLSALRDTLLPRLISGQLRLKP